MVAIGVGIGLVHPQHRLRRARRRARRPTSAGRPAILSTSRQVGSVVGVSVGLAIFQATSGAGAAGVSDGVSAVLVVAAVAALGGALAAGVRWTWPVRAEVAPA